MLHCEHIDIWDFFHENVIENDQPHTDYNFRAYISWYLAVTLTKLKGQWIGADYADVQSLNDEDTSYDLATREGMVVEAVPILNRVVWSPNTTIL
jgi:hypothetical protein